MRFAENIPTKLSVSRDFVATSLILFILNTTIYGSILVFNRAPAIH